MRLYDNFFLPADDLERARAFYAGTLDLPVKFELTPQEIIAFRVGDEEPALFLGTRWTKPAIWFEVADVRATAAELAARGVTFLSEPFAVRTGLAVEFEDPFGNRLGITDYSAMPQYSRSPAAVSEQGSKREGE
jgi:predicted enzyme related to lactoylglutathione lyase